MLRTVVNTRAINLTEALLCSVAPTNGPSRSSTSTSRWSRKKRPLIAEEAAETLMPLAEERGVTIQTPGHVTPTVGSHLLLLLQMTTNLVPDTHTCKPRHGV